MVTFNTEQSVKQISYDITTNSENVLVSESILVFDDIMTNSEYILVPELSQIDFFFWYVVILIIIIKMGCLVWLYDDGLDNSKSCW